MAPLHFKDKPVTLARFRRVFLHTWHLGESGSEKHRTHELQNLTHELAHELMKMQEIKFPGGENSKVASLAVTSLLILGRWVSHGKAVSCLVFRAPMQCGALRILYGPSSQCPLSFPPM